MKIELTSVMVDDQEKARKFYTEVLGFVTKIDLPAGEARFLTVVSPQEPDGVQLLLEPNWNPAVPARAFQRQLFEAGIPATAFAVDNIHKEYERMKEMGVVFSTEPTKTEGPTVAVFDDTCGNLIQIYQV